MQNELTDICGIQYDLNNIFNVTYNVDVLKSIIISLSTMTAGLHSKVESFLNKSKSEQCNNEINNKFISFSENVEKRLKCIEQQMNIDLNAQSCSRKNDTTPHEDNSFCNSGNVESQITKLSSEVQSLSQIIQTNKTDINDLTNKIDKISSQQISLENIEDILVKIKIVDKNDINVSKLTNMKLEQQFNKKMNILDDRIKKLEKENLMFEKKIISFQDLFNNKLQNYSIELENKLITKFKSDIPNPINTSNPRIYLNSNANLDISSHLSPNFRTPDTITPELTKENNQTASNYATLNTTIKTLKTKITENTDLINNINKQLSTTNKKLSDLDRVFKTYSSKFNNDILTNEFNKVYNVIKTCIKEDDLNAVNDKVNRINTQISEIRLDSHNALEDALKCKSEIQTVFKKLEMINQHIIAIRLDIEEKCKSQKVIDFSKYMEVNVFNDFVKIFNREIEHVKLDIEHSIRRTGEFIEEVQSKANAKDVSGIENYLSKKIDDFKMYTQHKYADRISIEKTLKYIDIQLKHIIALASKQNDKGENWMLAKKTLNPHICASCETYLGELPEKTEYLVWNKIPSKKEDTLFERSSRVGNGFSRMLNMLKIDSSNHSINNKSSPKGYDNKHNYIYESDGEGSSVDMKKSSSHLNLVKRKLLPGLTKNNDRSYFFVDNNEKGKNKEEDGDKEKEYQRSMNLSERNGIKKEGGEEGEENNNNNNNDNEQPKVLKIYKKAKK